MNQKGMVHLSVIENEVEYVLSFPLNRPLGEIYNASWKILSDVAQAANDAVAQAKAKDAE